MVNYDVYRGIDATGEFASSVFGGNDDPVVGYRHILDPVQPASPTETNFRIFSEAENGFIPVLQFFNNGRNGEVAPDPSVDPFPQHPRVNNRHRFDTAAAATTFTPTLADYPNNRNDHPDFFDPAATPHVPPAFNAHFTQLSPSFNISLGEGYSFRFGDSTIHFSWQEHNRRFNFYIENGLTLGNIHAFDLEYFGAAQSVVRNYFTQNNANFLTPVAGRPFTHTNFGATRTYAFPGFNTQDQEGIPHRGDILVFPYAQNSDPPAGGSPVDHTLPFYFAEESSRLRAPFPQFETYRLQMPGNFASGYFEPETSGIQPAKPNNGLDIRFNLPSLFNEERGAFDIPIQQYRLNYNARFPEINANVFVGGRAATDTESFMVGVDLQNLTQYDDTDAWRAANYWRDDRPLAPGAQFRPGLPHTFMPNNDRMILHNVSLLHNVAANDIYPDRVRIKVGNLAPSVLHEFGQIQMIPMTQGAGTDNFVARSTTFAGRGNPITTFLDFNIVPIGGRMNVQIVPFNMHMPTGPLQGWYQMRTGQFVDTDPGGFAENLSTHFVHGETLVLFPLLERFPSTFDIVFHVDDISGSAAVSVPSNRLIRSQVVTWTPGDVPPIGIPGNFRVIKDGSERHVSLTPQLVPPDAPPAEAPDWGRWIGDLSFWMEWDIGRGQDIEDLLDMTDNEEVVIEYMVNLSMAPDTNHETYEDYLHVVTTIRRVPGNPLPQVSHVGQFTNRSTYGRSPIINVGPEDIRMRINPVTGQDMYFVALHILTDAVHLYRPISPPPPFIRNELRFPNVYFMNVRLLAWQYWENGNFTGHNATGGQAGRRGGIPSLFDYVVLDDMTEMGPPPPANLQVVADERPETAPAFTVIYDIPLDAIRTYLATGYNVETLFTVNLYVSQFEDALMDTFFPQGSSLNENYRVTRGSDTAPPLNSHVVYYDWDQHPAPDDPRALGQVDMSDPNIQRVLRGECNDVPTGVVRISDIPVLRNQAGPDMPLGSPVNSRIGAGVSQAELQTAIDAMNFILNPPVPNPPANYRQLINLTNLDENRRYFIFADLVVHQFVSGSALNIASAGDDLVWHKDTTSILSSIGSGTTVGTPQEPDPGLVGPPAPENLRAPVEHRAQTAASILWNPIFPAPGEQGVRIEWEIIRIRDGTRMTDEQMQSRQLHLPSFFADEINSFEKYAWATNTSGGNRYMTFLPSNEVISEPNARFDFDFEDSENITFRDMTLSPNRLYFYYVRTVRIVTLQDPQLGTVESRSVSNWVEVPVTTFPVTPPENLRVEDGEILRPGIDLQTQILVSWEHEDMARILQAMGTDFAFQYRIRESEGAWRDITTASALQMTNANLDPGNPRRIRYMMSGLDAGVVYQMQVRLRDIVSDDHSLWSNTITFVTDFPQEDTDLDRDIDDWNEFIWRKLQELLLRPFWFAQNTPTSSIMVYRPDDIFAGLMLESPGAIPFYNTDVNNQIIYVPASVIRDANENRRGFSTRYSDLDILFAPSFLNVDHNQALIDMLRILNARNSDISDYFVRMEFTRTPGPELFGVPGITRQTNVSMSLVATNDNIRNIRTWERNVRDRATSIVNNVSSDPVLRQNVRNLLLDGTEPEEMLDFVDTVVARASREIERMISDDLHTRTNGILSHETRNITEFNAAMHVVVTTVQEDTSVNAFRHQTNQWVPLTTVEYHNGRAITSSTPGSFAFTGRTVTIPGITEVPRASSVISIVARYGLEDLFGLNADLEQNANRQMVIGSMARIAGAPHGADLMTWAVENLNVNMSSRNATGLIQRQEAIAVVMAVYEHRTNSPVNTIMIRNFQNTAGMQLDNRYAQAVRAAFEIEMVSDTTFDPAGPITIGEFLNILAELTSRVPL